MRFTSIFLLLALSFCGCSLQKRLYTGGYYLDKGKTHSETSADKHPGKTDSLAIVQQQAGQEQAGIDVTASSEPAEQIMLPSESSIVACDTIYMVNGEKVITLVQSITENQIKCKPCNDPHGSFNIFEKHDILKICYSNGEKNEFSHGNAADEKYTPQFNLVFKQSLNPRADKMGTEQLEAAVSRYARLCKAYADWGGFCMFFPILNPLVAIPLLLVALSFGRKAKRLMMGNKKLIDQNREQIVKGTRTARICLTIELILLILLLMAALRG